MSRTYKDEHETDGWNTGRRLERRARPAGRMLRVLEVEAHAHGEDDELILELERAQAYEDEVADFEAHLLEDDWCGCLCRRCLLHDDCGSCLTGHNG